MATTPTADDFIRTLQMKMRKAAMDQSNINCALHLVAETFIEGAGTHTVEQVEAHLNNVEQTFHSKMAFDAWLSCSGLEEYEAQFHALKLGHLDLLVELGPQVVYEMVQTNIAMPPEQLSHFMLNFSILYVNLHDPETPKSFETIPQWLIDAHAARRPAVKREWTES